ncbi:MAG: Ig-like domain-containing protein [Nitrosomonas ureae]
MNTDVKAKSYRYSKWVAAGILGMLAVKGWSGQVFISVEEPTAGSTYSGVANIRGWVVGSKGISRVELYVDGRYEGNIPVGGKRSDVGGAYPNYPNAGSSGFSMAFNYSGEAAGGHSIRVRAIDAEGAVNEKNIGFQVARFDNPYVSNPSQVSLSDIRKSGDSIFYTMYVEGKSYAVRLDWRTEIQGYVLGNIQKNN